MYACKLNFEKKFLEFFLGKFFGKNFWENYCIIRYDFTSKIKRMYDDIANSATQQDEYNRTGALPGRYIFCS